jgi:hypothetical protein
VILGGGESKDLLLPTALRSTLLLDGGKMQGPSTLLRMTERESNGLSIVPAYCSGANTGGIDIKTINVKTGMPTVAEALQHLERELARSGQAGYKVVKLIHGYGSSGAGGEIRIAVQRRLTEMAGRGEIRACIFGEDWARSDQQSWALINAHSELKKDSDLGRRNLGITIVVL